MIKQIKGVYPRPLWRSDNRAALYDFERLIALIPAVVWAILLFGYAAILRLAMSAAVVLVVDNLGCFLQNRYLHTAFSPFRLRGAVLGLLIAMLSPSTLPVWMLLLGDAAIVLVLQLFRSETHFPVSLPAAAGCLLLLFPAFQSYPLLINSESGVTLAELLRKGDKPMLSITDMLLGRMDGSMGEIASLLLLLGGAYLVLRHRMGWQIPLAAMSSAGILAYLTAPDTMSVFYYMGAQLFSGAFLLVLLFILSDRATAPMSHRAGLLYGALYGVLVILFRTYTDLDGSLPAALICSAMSRALDQWMAPLPFGGRRS